MPRFGIKRKPKAGLHFFELLNVVAKETKLGLVPKRFQEILDEARVFIFQAPPPFFWEPLLTRGQTLLLDEAIPLPFPTIALETSTSAPLFFYRFGNDGGTLAVYSLLIREKRKNYHNVFMLGKRGINERVLLWTDGQKKTDPGIKKIIALLLHEMATRELTIDRTEITAKIPERRYARVVTLPEVRRLLPRN